MLGVETEMLAAAPELASAALAACALRCSSLPSIVCEVGAGAGASAFISETGTGGLELC